MRRLRRLLGWILLVLSSSAVLLGLLVWWLLRRKPDTAQLEAIEISIPAASIDEEPAVPSVEQAGMASSEPLVQPAREPAPVAQAEEEVVVPEQDPAVDDLRRVEGIGPKIASVLQEAGIRTYAQLAATEVSRIEAILEASDPRLRRLADPGTWPEQAQLAAAGEWEALQNLQAQLKGGRRLSGSAS